MYCANCGSKLSENAKFCPECGEKTNQTITLIQNNKKDEPYILSTENNKYIIPLSFFLMIFSAVLPFFKTLHLKVQLWLYSEEEVTSLIRMFLEDTFSDNGNGYASDMQAIEGWGWVFATQVTQLLLAMGIWMVVCYFFSIWNHDHNLNEELLKLQTIFATMFGVANFIAAVVMNNIVKKQLGSNEYMGATVNIWGYIMLVIPLAIYFIVIKPYFDSKKLNNIADI